MTAAPAALLQLGNGDGIFRPPLTLPLAGSQFAMVKFPWASAPVLVAATADSITILRQ